MIYYIHIHQSFWQYVHTVHTYTLHTTYRQIKLENTQKRFPSAPPTHLLPSVIIHVQCRGVEHLERLKSPPSGSGLLRIPHLNSASPSTCASVLSLSCLCLLFIACGVFFFGGGGGSNPILCPSLIGANLGTCFFPSLSLCFYFSSQDDVSGFFILSPFVGDCFHVSGIGFNCCWLNFVALYSCMCNRNTFDSIPFEIPKTILKHSAGNRITHSEHFHATDFKYVH